MRDGCEAVHSKIVAAGIAAPRALQVVVVAAATAVSRSLWPKTHTRRRSATPSLAVVWSLAVAVAKSEVDEGQTTQWNVLSAAG